MIRHLTRSRTLVSALAMLAVSSCLAGASTLSKAVRASDSMEPALSFPAEERAAQGKLDALRARTGKRPNILWLVIDDMGWGDPGAYGGGAVVGAATPEHGPAGARGPQADIGLRAADLHADPLRDPDRPPAGAHRTDPADSCGRQDHQKPLG